MKLVQLRLDSNNDDHLSAHPVGLQQVDMMNAVGLEWQESCGASHFDPGGRIWSKWRDPRVMRVRYWTNRMKRVANDARMLDMNVIPFDH